MGEMVDGVTRYAVYYTPEGPLAEFGAKWLGWDSAAGAAIAHATIDGLPCPLAQITSRPRKYGFHGTIKPPFFLADGTTLADLMSETEALCGSLAKVTLPGLKLAQLGRFLALVPDGDAADLGNVASTIVKNLDGFRAPPSSTELARRRKANLSPAQEANLAAWGYPYVMDQFRFHMTLTGPLEPADLAATMAVLEPLLEPILQRPFVIDSMSLLGSDQLGLFHVLRRYALAG